MIKLFWNTQNQNKISADDSNEKNTRDNIWGIYHRNNSDKWIHEILRKIKLKIVNNTNELERGDHLIVVDSSVEKKDELYSKLSLVCNKMFLIHLGDESGQYNLSSIYKKFNFVWRSFCSNKYFKNQNVSCLPIGYKSGTVYKKIANVRKYKWAFIGTPHKSSRHDLLYQFLDIKPSFFHKTQKFNEKIIDVTKMSEILSSTQFIPCPNGFVHPETYRVYEALECGCIPIVENAYKYYDRLFPQNPFLKVNKWSEAKPILNEWKNDQIQKRQEECKLWWSKQKKNLQEFVSKKINS